jgi:hypothetical protein
VLTGLSRITSISEMTQATIKPIKTMTASVFGSGDLMNARIIDDSYYS